MKLKPYPYDRLVELRSLAAAHEGGAVDLSIGDPSDPPPPAALAALAASGTERSYPASAGSAALRQAAAGWLQRRFGVALPVRQLSACVGTKEFVASLPALLARYLAGGRDTVLYPAVSYPTYADGATLAGLRAVAVPLDEHWRLDLAAVAEADAARALCLWVNSPANPSGVLENLPAAADWGRRHSVVVCSDECYAEFVWDSPPDPAAAPPPGRTVLAQRTDGVLAVHSLSKRSNFAGMRVGFYAGDSELVAFLTQARRTLGLMVPGPVQAAATVALDDDAHVSDQRARYRRRLELLVEVLGALGLAAELPAGGFYLWVAAPGGDSWGLAHRLATEVGMVVSPGEFYGPEGASHVRLAAVAPDERLAMLRSRLGRPEGPDGTPLACTA